MYDMLKGAVPSKLVWDYLKIVFFLLLYVISGISRGADLLDTKLPVLLSFPGKFFVPT